MTMLSLKKKFLELKLEFYCEVSFILTKKLALKFQVFSIKGNESHVTPLSHLALSEDDPS